MKAKILCGLIIGFIVIFVLVYLVITIFIVVESYQLYRMYRQDLFRARLNGKIGTIKCCEVYLAETRKEMWMAPLYGMAFTFLLLIAGIIGLCSWLHSSLAKISHRLCPQK